MKITPCGAVGEVTGSGYLVETEKACVLVDFGMFQGGRSAEARNPVIDPVRPMKLDAVVATHAHLDHVGRMPLLPHRGFRGPIYATPATIDFAELVLNDSARLQESDAERASRRLLRAGRKPLNPLYGVAEVKAVVPLFTPIPYNDRREIAPGIEIRMVDAGHILGSASVEMTIRDGAQRRVVIFSGDIGLAGSPIVQDPVPFEKADLVIMESTYGDRDHRPADKTLVEFEQILRSAVQQQMKVLIPSFAIGRTQEVLYRIADLRREGKLPSFPIYLDSPMAIAATRLYTTHRGLFDKEAGDLMRTGKFLRELNDLHFTETVPESQAISESWDMGVIIAGSGMCDGGRIVHHLRHNLWRRNVAVMIVGYQAQGSLGRRLVDGASEVRIFGEKVVVRAQVHTLGGFSAHAGQSGLLDWLGHVAPSRPRVVLTHGEPKAREALTIAVRERFGLAAESPQPGDVIEL